MSKALIVLQSSSVDQVNAMDLARLIADMEPEKCKEADFMFANSFNSWPSKEVVNYVARKFNTITFNSSRMDTGWPAGPNSTAFSVLDRVYMGVKREGWNYDMAVMMEPDMVPTRRGWIKELADEFRSKGKLCGGFLYAAGMHPVTHINGGFCVSPLIRQKHRDFFWARNDVGWDVQWADMLVSEGYPSELFWVDYRCTNVTEDQLYKPRRFPKGHPLHKKKITFCVHHGCKDGSARQHVRNKLGI